MRKSKRSVAFLMKSRALAAMMSWPHHETATMNTTWVEKAQYLRQTLW
jgi:hypothetical protein